MDKAVFTVEEMGAYLGIGRSVAYELVHAVDGPPVIRIGRCIRIPVDGLKAWMESRSGKEERA